MTHNWDEIAHLDGIGTVYERPHSDERVFIAGRNGQVHFYFNQSAFPLPREPLETAHRTFDAETVLIHVFGPRPTWDGQTIPKTLAFDIDAYLDAETVPVFDEQHASPPVATAHDNHDFFIYPSPPNPESCDMSFE